MDFEEIGRLFKEYVNTFDFDNENIKLKYYHTLEVADLSYKIASDLGLSEEEKDLAKLIGYLHDIGRFEQMVKTNTFLDKVLDHADNGIKVLFDEGLIRKFIKDNKYDDIIRKAVKNHNKYKILDEVSDEEKLFANIIRDSDKIDIFRVRRLYNKDKIEVSPSKEVLESIYRKEPINIKDIKNKTDSILCVLAFIFDINYKCSIKLLKEKGYYVEFLNNIEVNSEQLEMFNKVKEILLKELEV